MKKYFGIALLIVLNAFSIVFICFGTQLLFAFFSILPLPEKEALELANQNTLVAIIAATIMTGTLWYLNFILFKNMLDTRRYILWSSLVALFSVLIFIPVLWQARELFIAYHKNMIQLKGDMKSLWNWLF